MSIVTTMEGIFVTAVNVATAGYLRAGSADLGSAFCNCWNINKISDEQDCLW